MNSSKTKKKLLPVCDGPDSLSNLDLDYQLYLTEYNKKRAKLYYYNKNLKALFFISLMSKKFNYETPKTL
jgi:hypothetical protein